MAKREYTPHQQNIISNYYQHLDTILLGRVQELVSQIYLAQTERQRQSLWKRVEKALLKLKIPDFIRQHILQKKDVELLAKNLEEWMRSK
ncbi:MAG TPA: hypothetical protein PK054_05950 [Anaerohalosphaeraceae bacterium]|nr:hypothetical protein [Anaerohalosphaeraceae bacterium]HOL88964.1 hypothetical protein [Anaerohalosphaeraceae bacterium]HPP56110.1 hypothetical protein [Anaerohalosphaeraceae bacterium]